MASAYLKLGDLKGDSLDARFPGWIPVESFSLGRGGGIPGPGSSQSQGATVQITEMHVSKFTDRSSPDLHQAVVYGTTFDVAVLAIAGIDEGKTGSAYVMENTLISSYNHGGSGGDRPMETLSLNFSKITIGTMAQFRTLSTLLQMAGKAVRSLTGRKP